MKAATVALIVSQKDNRPTLVETLSDDREIAILEMAVSAGEGDPLGKVREHRERLAREENDFADYVEELLSQPFIKPEIQDHGVQWLRSKIRIEQYQKSEIDAAQVIASYAFQIYSQEPERKDFFLAGPTAQVRVRVFEIPEIVSFSDRAA